MEIKILSENIIEEIENNMIKLFSDDTEKYIKIDCLSIGKLKDILENKFPTIEFLDDYDSNGWQADFWESFDYKDERYCMSGSGFYGGISVSRD